ncbi:unnamed protein product [Moneuplotes crassus]|uniref:Uncharacterized protein n=1 Tax=Euplotes crassus TaxID=5936 RepID=A0AAD2D549_EUPCR|nr:unnamed protein product [Moneuplotes crassus]
MEEQKQKVDKGREEKKPDFQRIQDYFKPRPHYSVKRILEDQDKVMDIENFMMNMQVRYFRNDFFKKIKIFSFLFSILVTIIGICIHFYMEDNKTAGMGRNRCFISAFLTIATVFILHYFPERHGIIAPVMSVWLFICMSDFYESSDRFVMHEYALPTISYAYLIMVLVPSSWKSHLISCMLGFLYYLTKIVKKRGEIPTAFWISMIPTFFYFISIAFLINMRLKELYSYIRKIEVMRNETKSILESFPNAFSINPCHSEDKGANPTFTNQEFDQKILDVKNKVNDIKNVEIQFSQRNKETEERVKCDLKTYLDQVHKRLTNLDIFEQSNIRICRSSSEKNIHHYEDQVYTIKSFEVKWNEQRCFMDVFISNTDIFRFEQAQKEIKKHKLMLGRASDELQTSLESILHSFTSVKENTKSLCDITSAHDCKERSFKDNIKLSTRQIFQDLNSCDQSSQILLSLSESMRDFSKIDIESIDTSIRDFNLRNFMEEIHQQCLYQTRLRGVKLTTQIEKHLTNVYVASDRAKIKLILINLVMNRLKYLPEQNILIQVKPKKSRHSYFLQFTIMETYERECGKLKKNNEENSKDPGEQEAGEIRMIICQKYIEKLGGKFILPRGIHSSARIDKSLDQCLNESQISDESGYASAQSLRIHGKMKFIIQANKDLKIIKPKRLQKGVLDNRVLSKTLCEYCGILNFNDCTCQDYVDIVHHPEEQEYWPEKKENQAVEFDELFVSQEYFNESPNQDLTQNLALTQPQAPKLLPVYR